jgi:acyl-CoA reductase-like NAD-dependent aldehyde dehydrogenase
MKQYKMWIGGKWVDAESGKTYPVYNPATEEIIAELPFGGKAEVDKAVAAARKAFPVWSGKPQAERSQIAMKIAAPLRDNSQAFGNWIHWITALPLPEQHFYPLLPPKTSNGPLITPAR